MAQLDHALGVGEIAKCTAAEVVQPRVRGQQLADEITCRAGQKRLTAVSEFA
jgi:hypothetical protein